MATVTERPRSRALAESNRRVLDPLRRLRGYIRRYVITEALLVMFTCLAACFWVGVVLDFGLFRPFGVDFADAEHGLPRWFRALGLGVALLVVFYFTEGMKALRPPPRSEVTADRGRESWAVKLFSNPGLVLAMAAPLVVAYLAGWV